MSNNEIYQRITDLVIEQLEKGVKPWARPFVSPGVLPMNLISKAPYRGINLFILSSLGFGSPYFLTFKQVKRLGGTVIKGESSTPIVFWKFLTKKDKEQDSEKIIDKIPLLRYYNVFNLEQTTGIDPKYVPNLTLREHNPILEADCLIEGYLDAPKIIHTGEEPYYQPYDDKVVMPPAENFKNEFLYYSVLFHELGHSTGHESRLNRELWNNFGSHKYSFEELVAEMTAAYLCGTCGFIASTIDNTAAYLDSWSSALSNNPNWLVQAAGKAQKAADYIQGITPEFEERRAS